VVYDIFVDSHDKLIQANGLNDDPADTSKLKFARVEVLPPDGNVFEKDFTKWEIRIDQSITPDWYAEKEYRQAISKAWHSVYNERVLTEGTHYLSRGLVFASGSASVKAYGSANVEAYGSANVEAYGSARVKAYGSASVEAYGSASVKAYGSASVEACGSASVEACGSASVEAGGSASVEAGGSASVKAYGSASVKVYGSAIVEAYGSGSVEASGSGIIRDYRGASNGILIIPKGIKVVRC
jgi:hypothetical protein